MMDRLPRAFPLIGFAWITLTGTVVAQTDSANSPMSLPVIGQSDLWPSVARLFGALVLVLVLAWGVLWLLRRTMKGRWTGAGGSGVKVLERVYLAPRKSIEVVLVGRRILVLGVTDSQIRMLTEVTPEDLGLGRVTGSADPTGDLSTAVPPRPAERLWQEARRRLGGAFRSIGVMPRRVTPTG